LMVEVQKRLADQDIAARVVSRPCWELFEAQPEAYRQSVLPPSVRVRIAAEAGVLQGWHRYVGERGDVVGVDRFGASAPGPVVMREYGFTVENILQRTLSLLQKENR